MIPDRMNIDRVALQAGFLVTAAQTVRPGFQVKFSATQTNPNVWEVQEVAAPTDVALGVAGGVLGSGPVAAGTKISVTCYFHIVERAIAGTGGVTKGTRVAQDPAGSTGLVNAPASNPAGATLTFSPGIALTTQAIGEAFPLAVMPLTYVTT